MALHAGEKAELAMVRGYISRISCTTAWRVETAVYSLDVKQWAELVAWL